MKRSRRTRAGALAFACLLLLGGAAEAWAQDRVHVSNPTVYSRTRQNPSDRAAARAALKRKKQRQKARRTALRRTVN